MPSILPLFILFTIPLVTSYVKAEQVEKFVSTNNNVIIGIVKGSVTFYDSNDITTVSIDKVIGTVTINKGIPHSIVKKLINDLSLEKISTEQLRTKLQITLSRYEILTKLLKQARNKDKLANKALHLLNSGKISEAGAIYDKILNKEEHTIAQHYIQRASIHELKFEYTQAIKLLERADLIIPNDPPIKLKIAELIVYNFHDNTNLDHAEKVLNSLIETLNSRQTDMSVLSNLADAQLLLGLCLHNQGTKEKRDKSEGVRLSALHTFGNLLALKPTIEALEKYEQTARNLMVLYGQNKQFDKLDNLYLSTSKFITNSSKLKTRQKYLSPIVFIYIKYSNILDSNRKIALLNKLLSTAIDNKNTLTHIPNILEIDIYNELIKLTRASGDNTRASNLWNTLFKTIHRPCYNIEINPELCLETLSKNTKTWATTPDINKITDIHGLYTRLLKILSEREIPIDDFKRENIAFRLIDLYKKDNNTSSALQLIRSLIYTHQNKPGKHYFITLFATSQEGIIYAYNNQLELAHDAFIRAELLASNINNYDCSNCDFYIDRVIHNYALVLNRLHLESEATNLLNKWHLTLPEHSSYSDISLTYEFENE